MKTKAAVIRDWLEPVAIEELELEKPKEKEVLVKVAHCGYCHSDLSMWRGEWGLDNLPFVPGHEVCGVVEEVGPGVTSLEPGDHVVSCWVAPCGQCKNCVSGRTEICETLHPALSSGRFPDGTTRLKDKDGKEVMHCLFTSGFSEYLVAPEISSVKVPKELPMDQACLLGCCVMTGWGTATRSVSVQPGDAAAVWGIGGIGLNVIQGLKLAGADPIVAVDLEDDREELARKMGATHFINNSKEDPVPIIREKITGERGVDYTFIGTGDSGAYTQAFFTLAIGGKMVGIGVPSNEEMVSLPFFMVPFGSLGIQGAIYGNVRHAVEIPAVANMTLRGQYDLESLITDRFKLEDINDVIEAMDKRQITGRWVCDM